MEINEFRKHKRFSYSIKEKLAIIDYYNTFNTAGELKFSKNDVYRKFNIEHKSFNEWLKNEEEMPNSHEPNKKKALHKGKPSSFTKEEKQKIINWVENATSNFIPLNFHIADEKIITMDIKSLN